MDTPDHLGGHQGIVHTDVGALDYLIERFHPETSFDLGCGPGWMVHWMNQRGLLCFGIDGDPDCRPDILHDFTLGPLESIPPKEVGLCWSVEFLEHIEERFMVNVWPVIESCKVVFCTHALPPDAKRKNHWNCQPEHYWIDAFEAHGFRYDEEATKGIRAASTMNREFVRETGKVFVR